MHSSALVELFMGGATCVDRITNLISLYCNNFNCSRYSSECSVGEHQVESSPVNDLKEAITLPKNTESIKMSDKIQW